MPAPLLQPRVARGPSDRCHNPRCKSKGKRVTVRRYDKSAHGFGLKFRRGFTRACEGAPKVFRSRKNAKVHHGNLEGGTRFRSSRHRQSNAGTHGRRSAGQGTAGRRREVRLGLSRRRGSLYLRRVLQAGHHPARAGAPRAGRSTRRRRLRARDRRCRRCAGDFRAGPDQCGHRYCDCLHGQHPDGDHLGPGADGGHRARRIPGMRHRRHHAADRQAQLPRQGSQGSGHDDEEGLPHRAQRPAGPGGGGCAEGRVLQEGQLQRLSRQDRDALVQPRAQGPWRPDPQGAAVAAERQASLHLYRRRRAARQRDERTAHAGRPAGLPGHPYADGAGCVSGQRPQVSRHAGHARHHRGQQRDAELRRAAGRRCALRRPRDRQPEALRAERTQDHPHRHRPVEHLEARPGRHPDRRRREGRADRADLDDQGKQHPTRRRGASPAGGTPSRAGAARTASSTTAATRT